MVRKKAKSNRVAIPSRGLSQQSQARQRAQRLKMKIARWKRNQTDPMKEQAGKSKNGWDTSRMEAHLKALQKVVTKPAKR